jgi:hypothetical protein
LQGGQKRQHRKAGGEEGRRRIEEREGEKQKDSRNRSDIKNWK